MSHWTQNSHKLGVMLDYRRFVVVEVAKMSGIDEDAAFYHTRLEGWDQRRNTAPRTLPSRCSLDQGISLIACTEWRELTLEQAKEVARAAGIADDGKDRRRKGRDPRGSVRGDYIDIGLPHGKLTPSHLLKEK